MVYIGLKHLPSSVSCYFFRLVTNDTRLTTRCYAPYEYRNKINLSREKKFVGFVDGLSNV